jgi:hypothetical protein
VIRQDKVPMATSTAGCAECGNEEVGRRRRQSLKTV